MDEINIKPRQAATDRLYEMQLQRDVAIINARTVAEFGPLPPGGLPVIPKRKPNLPRRSVQANALAYQSEEQDMFKLSEVAAVATLSVGLAACEPSVGKHIDQSSAVAQHQVSNVGEKSPQNAPANNEKQNQDRNSIPHEIRDFVPVDSTLLAYKKFDLTGDGAEDAVIIIRHPVLEQYADYKHNPCDLIVLHGSASGFQQAAKSSKIIDCTYQRYSREIAENSSDLNDLIELGKNEITYTNEREKPSTSIYKFSYSKTKAEWHLSRAENYYQTFDTNKDLPAEVSEIATYPVDIPWITIENFDLEILYKIFDKNRKIEYSEARNQS